MQGAVGYQVEKPMQLYIFNNWYLNFEVPRLQEMNFQRAIAQTFDRRENKEPKEHGDK